VAREGIKLESKGCAVVTGAFRNRAAIIAAKDAVSSSEAWVQERDKLGMRIREWGVNWKIHTLFALLVEAVMKQGESRTSEPSSSESTPNDRYANLFAGWQGFIEHIEKMELMDVATEKYPLTGTLLSKSLGAKTGEWMKRALDVCMEWQLRNPGSGNINEAVEEVRGRSDELGIPKKQPRGN
jgi:tRNA nucleotidyltransferase (CCA-adding enzyme)